MKFLAKFFWPLLPVLILFVTYREANTSVRRYLALASAPAEAVETYKDMQGIATLVAVYFKGTQKLPPNFSTFLAETRLQRAGRGRELYEDAWGTPYQLRDFEAHFEVVSCGPDKICETEHDNLVEPVRKTKGKPGLPVNLEKLKADLEKAGADHE